MLQTIKQRYAIFVTNDTKRFELFVTNDAKRFAVFVKLCYDEKKAGESNMIFRRKIYEKMIEWKRLSHGESALILEGARRVGKSTVAEEFAKNEYEDYLLIDFANENKEVLRNFEENISDLDTFFRNLFLLKEKSLVVKKSVIIFDEVQLFPLARQAIKYLVKDGRYDYIETGSLISIKKNVKNILIPSEEYRLKMYPMDFEEFLWAKGDNITYDAIRDAFQKRKPLGEAVHRKIMNIFRTYMAVGGMPQAVNAFLEGRDYSEVDYIKRNILSLYEEDLKKYDEDNKDKASVVFKTIPEQLSNHNSHFKLSLVDKKARFERYMETIDFVAESMMGNSCINVTKPEISLGLYADRSNFKLYMGDTGLLVTQIMKNSDETDENLYKALIFDKLGINQGIIMENVVAQMLRANGTELFYHEFKYRQEEALNESSYEIDFITVRKKKIVPIEVKSSSYKQHKSFDYLIDKYQLKSEQRYIIYAKDLQYEDNVTYIPIYMTGLI